MIRVLLVEDHAIVRKGLRQVLSEQEDITVAGEAASGSAAMDILETEEIDVILLDINLPGPSGMDLLQLFRRLFPAAGVLILTIYSEEQYAFRAIKLGASGYLTKDSAPEELVTAVRRIASGRKYITAGLAEKLAVYLETDTKKQLHESLSLREYQVFTALAAGHTVGAIAAQMNLSVKTVSTYRSRILQKMKMSTNADLTAYAYHRGLVE